jgi:1-acyl-sn-glycerol-3-phosphate acyltransferase
MSERVGASKAQARARRLIGPLATRLWTINREGYERLPVDGPAILMLTVPRNISFVGKAEYMDSWKTKFIFPAMGMIPIDRSGGSKSQAALDTAKTVLNRGELFAIFPEGTRSRDGDLYKGRTGAARLAMTIGCPIFPVGIVGTDHIQPVDARLPKLGKECTITIGRPIRPERYRGRGPEHLAWRSMTDEVMYEIREMTGQPYHNVYSGQAESEQLNPSKVATVADEERIDERILVAAG